MSETNLPDAPDERLSKIKYIEDRASLLLTYRVQRMEALSRDGQTTITWLFGLMVGSVGYIYVGVKDGQWWILPSLVLVALLSAYHAHFLIRDALLAKPVPSVGSDPDTLLKQEVIDQKECDIREGVVNNMQADINALLTRNQEKAAAINRAREGIVTIAMAALILAAISLMVLGLLAHPFIFEWVTHLIFQG